MLISHVGDLLISGTGSFVAFTSGRLENEYALGVPDENEPTYLRMGIKKAFKEFIDLGNISNGARTLRGRL